MDIILDPNPIKPSFFLLESTVFFLRILGEIVLGCQEEMRLSLAPQALQILSLGLIIVSAWGDGVFFPGMFGGDSFSKSKSLRPRSPTHHFKSHASTDVTPYPIIGCFMRRTLSRSQPEKCQFRCFSWLKKTPEVSVSFARDFFGVHPQGCWLLRAWWTSWSSAAAVSPFLDDWGTVWDSVLGAAFGIFGSHKNGVGYGKCYPMVNIQKTMEHHHFSWVNPL